MTILCKDKEERMRCLPLFIYFLILLSGIAFAGGYDYPQQQVAPDIIVNTGDNGDGFSNTIIAVSALITAVVGAIGLWIKFRK